MSTIRARRSGDLRGRIEFWKIQDEEVKVTCVEYKDVKEIRISDHKPVRARLNVRIPVRKDDIHDAVPENSGKTDSKDTAPL